MANGSIVSAGLNTFITGVSRFIFTVIDVDRGKSQYHDRGRLTESMSADKTSFLVSRIGKRAREVAQIIKRKQDGRSLEVNAADRSDE